MHIFTYRVLCHNTTGKVPSKMKLVLKGDAKVQDNSGGVYLIGERLENGKYFWVGKGSDYAIWWGGQNWWLGKLSELGQIDVKRGYVYGPKSDKWPSNIQEGWTYHSSKEKKYKNSTNGEVTFIDWSIKSCKLIHQ